MLDKYFSFVTYNWFTVMVSLMVAAVILNMSTTILEKQLSLVWKKLKILPSMSGATFDAMSSSLPEFLTSLVGLMILKEKWLDVWMWTIWGSAIFNMLMIPALVLLYYKWWQIKVDIKWVESDSMFYILSVLILLMGLYVNQLLLMAGTLVLLYFVYIFYLYKESLMDKKENMKKMEEVYNLVKDKSVNYMKIMISLVLIYIWVEISVMAVQRIWLQLNISVLVISLILLAWITSVPDTLLSMKASSSGDMDAGLSNAVWSNIFDVCMGLWLPILMGMVFMKMSPQINLSENMSMFVFLMFSTMLYFALLHKKNLTSKDSYLLLGLYAIFMVYLIWMSN